jgi:hypothetical protein
MKIFKTQSVKLLIISALCALAATLSYAQGVPHDRVIQDFTRTNRLTGTPSANLSNTVIPNQSAATGSMCGLYASGGLSFTCLGYDPSSSCPSGYYSQWFPVAEGHWWASCIKS